MRQLHRRWIKGWNFLFCGCSSSLLRLRRIREKGRNRKADESALHANALHGTLSEFSSVKRGDTSHLAEQEFGSVGKLLRERTSTDDSRCRRGPSHDRNS
jgi:hypothetical protein